MIRQSIVNIQNLVSDEQCYETVRTLRWPTGIHCPHCEAKEVIKRGYDEHHLHRRRYRCKACGKGFDDLTETVFSGHHQPLKTWMLCLYFMGLNLSNGQIARELDLNKDDVHQMTSQLREGVVKKTGCEPVR